MNLYLLVEGRRTERRVYPAWFRHLLPELRRVERFDEVDERSYFVFSSEGYPSILGQHLPNAVRDVNAVGRYDYLVVCLDSDEHTAEERRGHVEEVVERQGLQLVRAKLAIIVQHRCIETWFLGNRRVVPQTPRTALLAEYMRHYNVRERDPESMVSNDPSSSIAAFHLAYLRTVFESRNIAYSKSSPGHVCDSPYLDELLSRATETADLASFRTFVEFCDEVRLKIRTGG